LRSKYLSAIFRGQLAADSLQLTADSLQLTADSDRKRCVFPMRAIVQAARDQKPPT
jgi:hypothetical protein